MPEAIRRAGKVILAFFAVLGAINAYLSIHNSLSKPEPKLVATLEYGDIFVTPADEAMAGVFADLTAGKWQVDSDHDSDSSGESRHPSDSPHSRTDVLEQLIEHRFELRLRQLIPWDPLGGQNHWSGYYKLMLRNDGTQAATDVRLARQSDGGEKIEKYRIERDDGRPGVLSDGPIANIGTLQPKEGIRLVIFSRYQSNTYFARELKLTHSSGIGKISVLTPVGTFGQVVDSLATWPTVLFLPFLILLVLWVLAIIVLGLRGVSRFVEVRVSPATPVKSPVKTSETNEQSNS